MRSRASHIARASARKLPSAMPYVGSSGRKLYVDGPRSASQEKQFAYFAIIAAILLSVAALVRLGAAASAAVAAVSGAATAGATIAFNESSAG